MDAEPSEIALEVILQRVSDHLDALAGEVHSIEHVIGSELSLTSGQSAQSITRLQRLDYLRQCLEDLAMLTLLLSNTSEGSVCQSLAKKLRLATSKDMFKSGKVPQLEKADDGTLGEIDLF